jgi:uncharacterized protein (DUF885 family)
MLISIAGTFCSTAGVSAAGRKSMKRSVRGAALTARPVAPNVETSASEMRELLESYNTDRGSLGRTYPDLLAPARRVRFKQFLEQWQALLAKVDFEKLDQEGRINYLLFRNHLDHEQRLLELQAKQWAEVESLAPFARGILELDENRRRLEPVNSPKAAALLTDMVKQIGESRRKLGDGPGASARPGETAEVKSDTQATLEKPVPVKINKAVANRAAANLTSLRNTLKTWFDYYNGYDPTFSWWVAEPFKSADQALMSYSSFMSEKAGVRANEAPAAGDGPPRAGRGNQEADANVQRANRSPNARAGDASDIVGDPIGREGLMVELAAEMIPYTPEELIAIANKEFAWCEAEMKKAARDLGFGEDWHKALEHVKSQYVDPGRQPELIRDLALEAIDYVVKNDLVTVPTLARETWRMQMMTPERQLVSPFFLGGETILVSYPTNTMSHEQKLMSMRGNNKHFARATVFHELIPGHHLQGFMNARYKPYRAPFRTPFWGEGWALYWEMLLWDRGFAKSPEDRIGMLFWRMHRCARIIFSLSFHMGQMSPKECIDLLVKRVGHEPENATAEVRRSFDGSYPPLYQAAYLLGGMQIYSLHKELVDSGRMTNRAFHDAILQENSMPIEMVRASLLQQKLGRDFSPSWKFYHQN